MKIIQIETIKASISSGTAKPTSSGSCISITGNIRMAVRAAIPFVMLNCFIVFSFALKPIRIKPIGASTNSAKATIPCNIG